jgi:metal-dependent amidase/aminoacylase/carboxypeptidase family protein
VSTKSSIFYAEDSADACSCHIFWELAERELRDGQLVAAPLYMELTQKGKSGTLKIPAETARAICAVLEVKPDWQIL